MTLDEALAAPGRKAQTSGEMRDGQRVIVVYELSASGARPLAVTNVSVAAHDATVAHCQAFGCERAETEFLTRVVWLIALDRIEVFDHRRKQLHAERGGLKLVDGRFLERSQLTRVFTWASDDYAHRGVMAALQSGEEVELVTEISLAATGDPTYNRNDLLFDSGWCTTLGRAIAAWASVPFEDRI